VASGHPPPGWSGRLSVGYFDSKLAAQEVVNRYVLESSLPVVSVLPGTNFGPYDHLLGNGLYLTAVRSGRVMGHLSGGGLPLTDVRDQAQGHWLAMERGETGRHYIIAGRDEDNLTGKEMFAVIASVVQEKEPGRRCSAPRFAVPRGIAMAAAWLVEVTARVRNQPTQLSREAVTAGSLPLFYTSSRAREELGYASRYSFRQAVEDMYDYYRNRGMLGRSKRAVDSY